jgi:hypothetical protein
VYVVVFEDSACFFDQHPIERFHANDAADYQNPFLAEVEGRTVDVAAFSCEIREGRSGSPA